MWTSTPSPQKIRATLKIEISLTLDKLLVKEIESKIVSHATLCNDILQPSKTKQLFDFLGTGIKFI